MISCTLAKSTQSLNIFTFIVLSYYFWDVLTKFGFHLYVLNHIQKVLQFLLRSQNICSAWLLCRKFALREVVSRHIMQFLTNMLKNRYFLDKNIIYHLWVLKLFRTQWFELLIWRLKCKLSLLFSFARTHYYAIWI